MALLFDNLEAIVLKRCLAFEPRAVRTKIGFPFCPLASVYTSMPDVFQARRNLQSHFSKSRLDCAHCIGLCPLHWIVLIALDCAHCIGLCLLDWIVPIAHWIVPIGLHWIVSLQDISAALSPLQRYVPSLRRTENWLDMITYTSYHQMQLRVRFTHHIYGLKTGLAVAIFHRLGDIWDSHIMGLLIRLQAQVRVPT